LAILLDVHHVGTDKRVESLFPERMDRASSFWWRREFREKALSSLFLYQGKLCCERPDLMIAACRKGRTLHSTFSEFSWDI
jgi:hypothetical protein